MPFTLSHPAAVLPFLRPPFSATALLAGAVAPDLPYFLRSAPVTASAQSWYEPFLNATTTHTPRGAVTVALPLALVLCGLLGAARRPVLDLLPVDAGPGWPRSAGPGALLVRSGWVLVSLVIGIATHLVWDSFTHGDGYVVTHVALLRSSAAGDLTWARALQHLSTVVGLAVIAVYLWRRRSRWARGRADDRSAPAWAGPVLGVLVAGTAGGAIVNTLGWWDETGRYPARQVAEGVLSDAAKGAGLAFGLVLALYVAAWWVRHRFAAAGRR